MVEQVSLIVREPGSTRERQVKLSDLVCWRALQGKPCFNQALAPHVVIIPIAQGREHSWADLVHCCQHTKQLLSESGLTSVHVDEDARSTPGSKFHKWEKAGVRCRLEIGPEELVTRTFTLAVHPALKQQAEEALAAVGLLGSSPTKITPMRVLSIQGLTETQLLEACDAVMCAAQANAQQHASSQQLMMPHVTPAHGWTSCSSTHVVQCASVLAGDLVHQEHTSQLALPPPDPLCTGLHLWPGCNHPLSLWSRAGLLPLLGSPDARPDIFTPDCAAASRLVCVDHVRHLLGVGQACHCHVGHVTLQELQQQVVEQCSSNGRLHVVSWVLPARSHHSQVAAPADSATELRADVVSGDISGADDPAALSEEQEQSVRVDSMLHVTGIPAWVPAAAVKEALLSTCVTLGLPGVRVRVSRCGTGKTYGWARLACSSSQEAEQVLTCLDRHTLASDEHRAMPHIDCVRTFTPIHVLCCHTGRSTQPLTTCMALTCVQVLPSAPGQQQQQGQEAGCAQGGEVGPDSSNRGAGFSICVSRCCGRRDTLFSHVSSAAVRCRLRVDSVSAYSITDSSTARSMAELLAAVVQQASHAQRGASELVRASVIDGTACSGGNTLALARVFGDVIAIELDVDRAADLLHNLRLLGHIPPPSLGHVQSQQSQQSSGPSVQVLCGDYTQLCCHLAPADCLLLDPPWGGPGYKSLVPTPECDVDNGKSYLQRPVAQQAGCGCQVPPWPAPTNRCPSGPGLQLGCTPLCILVGVVLGSGRAGCVALKLPTAGKDRHADLVECVAAHAAQTSTGPMKLWAARAQFGRTCLLLMVRLDALPGGGDSEQVQVRALKAQLRAWSVRECVPYQVLGCFTCQ